jgi:DNA repair exonuclease SbcCD ATPase subunit
MLNRKHNPMNRIFSLLLCAAITCSSLAVNAQQAQPATSKLDSLSLEVSSLRSSEKKVLKELKDLKSISGKQKDALNNQRAEIEGLRSKLSALQSDLERQGLEFSGSLDEARKEAQSEISGLGESISRNSLFWTLALVLLAFASVFAFIMLRKKVVENQQGITDTLSRTRQKLEEEAVGLDTKLAEILDTQLKLLSTAATATPALAPIEPNHSLALKVADNIVRIENNLSKMDPATKGLKQLAKAVESIRDNFAANGYEIVDLLNKPYDEGMRLTANFIPDDNLKPGERIITRIVKPQVNYHGEMIQAAHVEVSQGD